MSYICSTCDYASTTKLGKCPNCGEFGSFIINPERSGTSSKKQQGHIITIQEHTNHTSHSYRLHHNELDRVYSGGLQSSGVYLIAGEPGIGKSTIILQIIQSLITHHTSIRIGYFSGEESTQQILNRVQRIVGSTPPQLHIYYSTSIEDCLETAKELHFDMIIIDSIQMIASRAIDTLAGTPAQVKSVTELLTQHCKTLNCVGLIVGHVTKGGEIAGPKYLEHIVDVVSYLEGDRYGHYRFLKNKKNRYGSDDEVAVFEMTQQGLISARNITQANLGLIQSGQDGTTVSVGLDNGRPIVVGVECLCIKTKMNYAKRLASGRNQSRLDLMIAIIEKYCKINLSFYDVYCNVPGEIKIQDHGIDLAVVGGIISSASGKTFGSNIALIGEVGLGGQILPTKFHQKKIKELHGYTIIDYQTINHIRNLSEFLS